MAHQKKYFKYDFKIFYDKSGNPKGVICNAIFSTDSLFLMEKAKTVCCEEDTFDEDIGKQLAQAKVQKKILTKAAKIYSDRNDDMLKKINSNTDMTAALHKMASSVSTHERNIKQSISDRLKHIKD